MGHRESEQVPVVGLASEKLVPTPTLLPAQGRDAQSLPNVTSSQGGPGSILSPHSPLTDTSSLAPWQEGRAPILEGQQTTGIKGNTTLDTPESPHAPWQRPVPDPGS